MRRGCLFAVLGVLGLCLIVCGLGFFVGVPRIRDNAQDGVEDALRTQVAFEIPAGANNLVAAGTYTLSADELQQTLRDNVETSNPEDISVTIAPTGITLSIVASSKDSRYTGLPVAENGKLVVQDMQASNRFLDFIFPADRLGEAIENVVNGYLEENNLEITKLTLEDGKLILETANAS